MLSKIHQRLWEAGQSIAGDGMLLRLRNASIALVSAVAAVGLGLTLFISQLGFPAVFSGPIPDGPAQRGSVHNAIALNQSPAIGLSSPAPSTRTGATAPRRPRHAGQAGDGDSGGVSGGGSHQIAVSPGAQSSPAKRHHAAPAPVSTPATPAAEPSPPAPSPAPVPTTVESPSKSGSGGQSQGSDGKSTPSGPATAKLTSDGKSESGPSSKGPKVSKSDGNTVSGGKSTDSAAEKARHDQSAAAPSPVAPPAPAPSAAKPAPEATSPAAAKEAADSGR